jgi:hypothetical protein
MNNVKLKEINVAESIKNLKKIYKKTTFFTNYGTSIFLFIVISLLFFLGFSYYNVMNHSHQYRENPSKYRCHPTVMPFAGYIFSHPGMSNTEFNHYNFRYCLREILKDMLAVVLLPLEYVSSLIQQIHFINFGSLNWLRNIFSDIRSIISDIFTLFFTLLINLFAGLNYIIVYIADAVRKSTEIMQTGMNMGNLIIYCIRVIANITMWGIIIILIALGVIMLVLFAVMYVIAYVEISLIPIIGPIIAPFMSLGVGLAVTLIYVITYVIILTIYGTVAHEIDVGLQITSPMAPQQPKFQIPSVSVGRRRR